MVRSGTEEKAPGQRFGCFTQDVMTFTWEGDVMLLLKVRKCSTTFSSTETVDFHTALCLFTSVPGYQNLNPRETDGQGYRIVWSQGSEENAWMGLYMTLKPQKDTRTWRESRSALSNSVSWKHLLFLATQRRCLSVSQWILIKNGSCSMSSEFITHGLKTELNI